MNSKKWDEHASRIQQASTKLVSGFCDHSNEIPDSTRERGFLDQLSDY
jgi:hypothetical protein